VVESLLCLEKVGFVSSCLGDIFGVERGKIKLLCKVLVSAIFLGLLYSSSCPYSTKDEFGKSRTADKLGI